MGIERNNEDTEYSVNRIKFRLSLWSSFIFSYVNNKTAMAMSWFEKINERIFNSNVFLLFAKETEEKRKEQTVTI